MHASQYALPGLAGPKTYAPRPVWKGSTTGDVKFAPLDKRLAVAIYHDARRFERQTREPGRSNGTIGRTGLAVLHALLFDLLNFKSGRLDPCYATIARRACVSVRTVARALGRLRAAGVLNWVRRASVGLDGLTKQESNAYGISPSGQWRGYRAYSAPPPPLRDAWGAVPRSDGGIDDAVDALKAGAAISGAVTALERDPDNPLAACLARLARHNRLV